MILYLDKNQIMNLASGPAVFERGENYFAADKVGDVLVCDAKVRGEDSYVAKMAVNGNNGRVYAVEIVFDKTGNLQKYRCDCEAFASMKGGCKHVVASMLKIFEKNRELVIRGRMQKTTSSLLNELERLAMDADDEALSDYYDHEAVKVSLVPSMTVTREGGVSLSFMIGRSKLYVLKSITEFADDYKHRRLRSYGKSLEFIHKKGAFTPRSSALAELVLGEKSLLESAAKASGYPASLKSAGRSLPLSGRGVDAFFDIMRGEFVKVSIFAGDEQIIKFSDEAPDLNIDIKKTDNSVEMTRENGRFLIVGGESANYLLTETTFCKLSASLSILAEPLINAFSAAKTLIFDKSEFGRLSVFLLPQLKTAGMIDADFKAETDMPAFPLVARSYLDVSLGFVTCKTLFCYGNTEINALEPRKTSFARNVKAEYDIRKALRGFGFIPSETRDYFRLAGNDLIFEFYEAGLNKLREMCEVYATDEFTRKSERRKATASFGLRLESGILKVTVNTDGYSREELADVLRSYNLKKRYHRLKDGTYLTFDPEENGGGLTAASDLLSGLGITEKDLTRDTLDVPQYRALYAEQVFRKNAGAGLMNSDDAFKSLAASFGEDKDIEFDAPESLENILRPYQKDGYNWLRVLRRYGFGGVLADDMGLGKTLQVISVILAEKLENPEPQSPSIVVAPTSLIYNWEKEFNRFAPSISVTTIAGTALKRKETITADNAGGNARCDVYITTYDMLKRDLEHYADIYFRFIIADEAQNIKNPQTMAARAVKSLSGETKFALTGTPIENSLGELWSLFDFVLPGFLFNAAKFTKHYEAPILRNDDKKLAEELKKQISPFILRRVKRDVLTELPEKIETTIYAEMSDEQRKIYTAYLAKMQGELDETVKKGRFNESQIEILSMLTRLRQICCHPATFMDDYTGGSGKLNTTRDLVSSYIESGHRILIFSQFTRMLAIIRATLEETETEYFYLDGATPSKERIACVDRFNAGERQVFLISLKAGGTGLNLTGADVVIHYDPWWNPAVMDQASDRAHRIGQKNTVQVVNIVAKDSVEEKILNLQARKKDLVDMVITEGANFINKMSEDDILELFKE